MSSSDMLARELTDSDREECLREILEWEDLLIWGSYDK